jgi:uncharacterized protein YaeQ
MAANATIYKIALNIADMDHHYYGDHQLTIAKHPSENDLRMMIRVIAFIFNPSEDMLFGEGIAEEDIPDLWQKDLTGDIKVWIDLGQPDEKRLRKASGKSDSVLIYTYQEGPALAWYKQAEKNLKRFKNLSVKFLRIEGDIEKLVSRSMDLQCNISDGELTLMHEDQSVTVTQEVWKD